MRTRINAVPGRAFYATRRRAPGAAETDSDERRRLETEIVRISEREQRRIAEDLHDGLGQQLAGISCLTNVLKGNLADQASPEAETAAKIARLLAVAVAQTRSLAQGLYPVAQEPHGLMSALEGLATNVAGLFNASCRFVCRQPVLIGDNVTATHLYRIAQEAVTNALKHGRARRIKIELSATPTRIMLLVRNDGDSFRITRGPQKGLGLRIMHHRAELIGGTLAFRRMGQRGTEMLCSVPRTSGLKDAEE